MEEQVRDLVREALDGAFPGAVDRRFSVEIEVPRERGHGDLATNAALGLARVLKHPPRAIAETLAERLRTHGELFEAVEVAGPGFLNFRIRADRVREGLAALLARGNDCGRSRHGGGRRVMVEYVSANPTGPLNVVNARAAAFGGALVRLLDAAGYDAISEFYVNDVGRQIDLLGATFLARFHEVTGTGDPTLPEEGYRGAYLKDLAEAMDPADISARLAGKSPEEQVAVMADLAVDRIRSGQEQDLAAYGTRFDRWFRQHELYPDAVQNALERMRERGLVEERDGAVWFRSTAYGDDQDRVVVRANGEPTYFLADIAYHVTKHDRGVSHSIDIWGPDHHGYIGRMQAAAAALGYGRDWLEVLIVQQVNLLSGGEQVKMSKRRGEFITLQDLLDEVGKDAAVFFFLMRRAESHLDFDLDLAKKEGDENPVFYVKYAHARVSGILRKADEENVVRDAEPDLSRLEEPSEMALAKLLLRFPGIVVSAAEAREPHRLTGYLRDVAQAFHLFYHHCRVVTEDAGLTGARLALVEASRLVLARGLGLMDIAAPERM